MKLYHLTLLKFESSSIIKIFFEEKYERIIIDIV